MLTLPIWEASNLDWEKTCSVCGTASVIRIYNGALGETYIFLILLCYTLSLKWNKFIMSQKIHYTPKSIGFHKVLKMFHVSLHSVSQSLLWINIPIVSCFHHCALLYGCNRWWAAPCFFQMYILHLTFKQFRPTNFVFWDLLSCRMYPNLYLNRILPLKSTDNGRSCSDC